MSDELSHDEAISQFCAVTGTDEERAKGLLEACDWNLELAINMQVDTDPDGRAGKKDVKVEPERVSLDEDDEDTTDINCRVPQINEFFRAAGGAGASTSSGNDGGVRPPIAPVRQILNPNPIGYSSVELPPRYNTRSARPNSEIYDAFRDFRAEADWQETRAEGSSETNGTSRKPTGLQDLFRPPLDLMFHGSLTSTREAGTVKNKWMLVNIQNGREFACQTLNRDVWSNQAIKDIVKEHFIFWQVYHDSYDGQRYVQFYNVRRFPHVAIIDPRTGELVKQWPATIDHNSFCDSVIEFLTEHPSPDGSGDANTVKKLRTKTVNEEEDDDDIQEIAIEPSRTTLYDQSEEAQLEAAIKASLQEEDTTIEIDEDTTESEHPSATNDSEQQHHHQLNTKEREHPANDETEQPTIIDGPECKLALRFPDGSSLFQKFSAADRLSTVKLFVQMKKSTNCVEFIAPPNRKLTEAHMDETLESLGLCPASRLEVKCA